MNNFKKPGDTVTLPAPYAVASGTGALIGAIFGVSLSNYAQGQSGEWRRTGQIALPRATGTATTAGQAAYWDNTNHVVTNVSAGNKLIGAFIEPHASADTSCEVILIPTAI